MAQRIYLADDEAEIRSLMTEFLTQEGFQVSVFPDGDRLLSAVLESPPDLVILDILMPGTDGLSICSLLRKKDNSKCCKKKNAYYHGCSTYTPYLSFLPETYLVIIYIIVIIIII